MPAPTDYRFSQSLSDAIDAINQQTLTQAQVCALLNISLPTLYRRMKDGSIPTVRIGKSLVRIPRVAVEELLAAGGVA
jgi:excisionase family DNA binding protein